MTIDTPSRSEVKAQLGRIRRYRRASKGKSGKRSSKRGGTTAGDLQEIAGDLSESTTVANQECRGKMMTEEEESESRNHLLNGKL